MSIHKKTVEITIPILLVSIMIIVCDYVDGRWFNDLCLNINIGVFSSGLLLLVASLIGYVQTEQKLIRDYAWKICELKNCALELQTELKLDLSYEQQYCKFLEMHKLLLNSFAYLELDFLFPKRRIVKELISIHVCIRPLINMMNRAVECYQVYLFGAQDVNNERIYTKERFDSDMKITMDAMNNYDDSGKMLVLWLKDKEFEYCNMVNSRY